MLYRAQGDGEDLRKPLFLRPLLIQRRGSVNAPRHILLVRLRQLQAMGRVALDGKLQQFGIVRGVRDNNADGLSAALAMCCPTVPAVDQLVILIYLDRRQDIQILGVFLHSRGILLDPRIELFTEDHSIQRQFGRHTGVVPTRVQIRYRNSFNRH